MDLELDHHPLAFDHFLAGQTHIQPLMFSAQYNGEKLTLTGEYDYRWRSVQGYGVLFPDNAFVTASGSEQDGYPFPAQWRATVRYGVIDPDKDDRSGSKAASFGLPNHIAYTNDRDGWPASGYHQFMSVKGRVSSSSGTAGLSQADHPNRQTTIQDWSFMASVIVQV